MTNHQDDLQMKAESIKIHKAAIQDILIEAGGIVKKWYDNADTAVEIKEDGSPLTMADTETDAFLKKHLMALLPQAGWLSEETEDQADRLKAEWTWVVDPLDGTKEFTQHIPQVAVSIGLVYKNRVALGAMVNPITGEGGIGTVDGDVRFWDIDAVREPSNSLHTSVASVSRTELGKGEIDPFMCHVGTINGVGSVAYKLLRVAAELDHMTFSVVPKNEWDICGGVGLLQAAGKAYRRLDDEPVLFNQRDPLQRGGAVGGPQNLVDSFTEIYKLTTAMA